MRVYKDTVKSFFITLGCIAVVGIIGFALGSWILAPKQPVKKDQSYKPKVNYPNGPVKLTYWRTVDGKEVFEPIIKKWNEAHPNVTIEVINIPFAAYDGKLNEASKNGTLPDMFMLKSDWVPRYIGTTQPAPQEVFNESDYKNTFAPVVAKDLIKDGKVIAVSYGLPSLGLFYNQDLFSKAGISSPPSTWQELVDTNSKLAIRSGDGLLSSGIALALRMLLILQAYCPL